ncbi:hypothetical protein JB92DRAFT_3143895 [Gautieria morchelliformis]|nr:hypothetical protein JB92DRAFT_3146988 [Gautieria morchelliformis]KAF8512064.1 hypothetical protein JB92DRAFT_3143895 [Gautieria morchelliformis]
MGASRLPQELIDAVTDNLHEDHGALLACSLVCRSWLPSSQRHLFWRVTFALDKDRCEQLAQGLLNSPHLANYIRELEIRKLDVRVAGNHWTRERGFDPNQSLPAAALRKFRKLQSIHLYNLDMDDLTVDLRQSLRWVLLLPSLTSLKHRIGQDENSNFLQDLLTRGDQEDDEPRERSYLSHLDLELSRKGNLGLHVDWFLGPRSPFEVSHIQNLRVACLDKKDEEALNRLFRTIGGSLKQVEFSVPYRPYNGGLDPELAFDVKLEYNSNIRFLSLTDVAIDAVDSGPFGTAWFWLQRFLSNFDASNKIEQIYLEVIIYDTDAFREFVYSAAVWGQVDCILAEKFRKLEKLDINALLMAPEYGEIKESILDGLPMLDRRGVSVTVDRYW